MEVHGASHCCDSCNKKAQLIRACKSQESLKQPIIVNAKKLEVALSILMAASEFFIAIIW